ncbi:MAG: cation:proton antiporter [Mariprofundaceae bacterium]|nr:cation:proton antiporter [Mariprofundaceae bacterium]
MVVTLLVIATILFIALQLEDKLKIPSPLGLIGLSFLAHTLFSGTPMLTGDPEHFAALVLLLLPILLISDSFELTVADLKEHGLSLFYLAVVAVSLSVGLALLTAETLFGQYNLSFAAIIVLFAMVLATDPVSVVSIFSNFELPHRLKILAEGESLFNDATALIVFVFVGLYALDGGELTVGYVAEISFIVVLGSAALGIFMGYLGLLAMKTTENRTAELMIVILVGYGAFEASEFFYVFLNMFGGHSHLHLSGILSCIFATITLHHVMTKAVLADEVELKKGEEQLQRESALEDSSRSVIAKVLHKIKATVEERDRHHRTKEDVQLLAIVANTILFIAMAEIIDLKILLKYSTEILVMFVATTAIRALMMAKFAFITNQTTKMTNVNFRWWGVLTFAGIKGGLSVVMLMMIPAGFIHIELFTAIVVGVIMLSTFIYSLILLWIIGKNKEIFKREKDEEARSH